MDGKSEYVDVEGRVDMMVRGGGDEIQRLSKNSRSSRGGGPRSAAQSSHVVCPKFSYSTVIACLYLRRRRRPQPEQHGTLFNYVVHGLLFPRAPKACK
jgi:hypothetical protein